MITWEEAWDELEKEMAGMLGSARNGQDLAKQNGRDLGLKFLEGKAAAILILQDYAGRIRARVKP